jgi:hypothetical protein
MESHAKTLIAQPAPWTRAALEALARCERPKADALDGLSSIEEICHGGQLYALEHGGEVLAWYVVKVNEFDRGREAVVVAAAGRAPDLDLTHAIETAVLAQYASCDAFACITRRPALAKKLALMGYGLSGFVMRKRKWNA